MKNVSFFKWLIGTLPVILMIIYLGVSFFLYAIGFRQTVPKEITQTHLHKNCTTVSYPSFSRIANKGAVIPGLNEGGVPQGLCYIPEYNWILTTSYFNGGAPSTISIIDNHTKSLVKSIYLLDETGSFFCGHVGGITSNGKWIWIASENQIYTLLLSDIQQANDMDGINLTNGVLCITKADFTYWDGKRLWIGEYNHPPFYTTNPSHHTYNDHGTKYQALALSYAIDNATGEPIFAECGLYLPNKVQAMAMLEDGSVILSCSFWSFEDSSLLCYAPTFLNKSPNWITYNKQQIPVYFLADENILWEIDMPPMSEGITLIDGDINVLFESGSSFYSWYTAKRICNIMQISCDDLVNGG